METVRSFIAVEIPESVRSEITRLTNKFIQMDTSVRWVKHDNLHITLLFFGEVTKDFLKKAERELSQIAENNKSFDLSLKGIGAFPSQRSPRIVWVGTVKGGDELSDLQAKTESTLTKIGYKPEARKFHPHLTIGRVKLRFNNPQVFETNYESPVFPIKSIVLFKSTLMPEGPIYEKIKEFPLT